MNDAFGEEASESGFDIVGIIFRIWALRGWLLTGLIVGFLACIVWLHVSKPHYEADAVLRPKDHSSKLGALSALTGGLGSLGDVGASLSGSSENDYDAFTQLLDSDDLAQTLIREHPDLLPRLFPNGWDPQTKTWTHQGIMAALSDGFKALFGLPAWKPPGVDKLGKYIRSEVSSSTDFKSNMTTITYSNEDPVLARDLVKWVYSGADNMVRQEARRRSANRVAYLGKILPTVVQTDEHDVLTQLLAQEEQRTMMEQADEYFTIVPVERPRVSETPSGSIPARYTAFMVGGAMIGAFIGLLNGRWNLIGRFRNLLDRPPSGQFGTNFKTSSALKD